MIIKVYNLLSWIAVLLLSLAAVFGIVLCADATEQYLMALLPLVYILSISLSGAFLNLIDSSRPGFMVIHFLYFIKCVVYPFINVISGSTYISGNNDTIYAIALECPSLCLAPQKGKRKIKKGKEHWPLKFCGSGFRQWGRVFQQYGYVITMTICLLAPLLSGAAVFRAWIILTCGMWSFCTLVLTACVQAAP